MRIETERWEELTSLVERVPDDRMDEPSLNGDGWSVKDLLWHLRSWSSVVADQLERIRAGTFDSFDRDTDANNELFLAEGRALGLSEVRASLADVRKRGSRAMASLPDVPAVAEELFSESAYKHYDDHIPELRGLVEGPA